MHVEQPPPADTPRGKDVLAPAAGHGAPGGLSLDPQQESRPWFRAVLNLDAQLAKIDGWVLVVALVLSALLPTLSVILNKLGLTSSPWFQLLPRFGLLAIAFVGAGLATRTGGHIALDLSGRLLPEGVARWTRLVAESVASLASGLLAVGAYELILVERQAGTMIQQTLPSWVPGLFILWGLGLCALRFLWRAVKLFPPALGIIPAAFLLLVLAGDTATFWLGTLGLVAGILLGTPLFVVLGGAAVLLFYNTGQDLSAVHADTYGLSGKDALIALPLFTFMGAMLARSEAPLRLVRVARAWLGWMPGGLAVAAVVVSAFFTTFTGASGVTILALGLLLHKLLTEEGYPDKLTIGTITASGAIGLLFAPALPLMVYGIVGSVDIRLMFRGGVLPGVLLVAVVATTAVFLARRAPLKRHPFELSEALASVRVAVWDLLLPVLVLGLYLGGFAGVVQSAAAGVVYTLVIALVVHRDLNWREDLFSVARDSAVLIGAVLIILALAYGFTGYLVEEQVPQVVIDWAEDNITSRFMLLLSLNLLLLVVGCLLDIFSAMIIFVPLVMPVALAFDIHPVHLGVIFLANLEIGYLTPPVGMNLFLSSFRFKREMPEVWRTVIPFLLVLLGALMVITYVPELTTWMLPEEAMSPAGAPASPGLPDLPQAPVLPDLPDLPDEDLP